LLAWPRIQLTILVLSQAPMATKPPQPYRVSLTEQGFTQVVFSFVKDRLDISLLTLQYIAFTHVSFSHSWKVQSLKGYHAESFLKRNSRMTLQNNLHPIFYRTET